MGRRINIKLILRVVLTVSVIFGSIIILSACSVGMLEYIEDKIAQDEIGLENNALYSFELDVVTDGTGSGSIDTTNSTANGNYSAGTTITAQATSDSGSIFMGWNNIISGGTLISSMNPYVFSLNDNTKLYAKWANYTDMVFITGGAFTMGDTWGTGSPDELPTHLVTISNFLLGRYEVTFAEWYEVLTWAVINGYSFAHPGQAGDDGTGGGDTDMEPVTWITWHDVIVWCNAASEYNGLTPIYTYNSSVIMASTDTNACDNAVCNWTSNGFRLPTEAEWEYAAKGGGIDTNPGEFPGSGVVGEVAWYNINSSEDTYPVGEKQANELGLNDMSGNVMEWCWDWYEFYSNDIQADPRGPSTGTVRLLRGGGYISSDSDCRIPRRSTGSPSAGQGGYIGFRLVLGQ